MDPSFAPLQTLIGTVLRGTGALYHLQEIIGGGGQGWVFRASYDDAEGAPVVVKILRPDAASRDALERFRREAEILRTLSQAQPSPYIVRFYDHGQAPFPLTDPSHPNEPTVLPFTVLEYVHGEPLSTVIDRQHQLGLALPRVRRVAREVAKALDIVHARGIVHRDLKPSNILMSQEGGREVAKVTDFGLVKLVDVRVTTTQSLAGVSLSYAPPEQYEPGNQRVGAPTDVFSFATIIYEMLTGIPAFPTSRANPFEVLKLIASSPRPKLATRRLALPEALRARPDAITQIDAMLERALDPEPGNRPQTIRAFWEPLEPLLREVEASAAPPMTMAAAGMRALSPASAPVPSPAPSPWLAPAPPPAPDPNFRAAAAQYTNAGPPPPTKPSSPAPAPSGGVGSVFIPSAYANLPLNLGEPRSQPQQNMVVGDARRWSFRIVSPGIASAQARDGWIDDEAKSALVLGIGGLMRWEGNWAPLAGPLGLSLSELRCIAPMGPASWVFAGDHGMLAYLRQGRWDLHPHGDRDVTFHAVAVDPSGSRVFAVGERTSRGRAIAVELTTTGLARVFDAPDFAPFRAVKYVDSMTAYAAGDDGALARFEPAGMVRLGWERSGHLRALAVAAPRIFAVGTGGHALEIVNDGRSPPRLEKVMTTQDLRCAAVGRDGAAWAGSAGARILRRDSQGVWRRVNSDLGIQRTIIAIGATEARVLALADDGSVIEGLG